MKILVNSPSGSQELINVGQGGAYFEASRVLWDEREDGPLPEIALGGMVRVGAELAFDQARMDEHVAASAPTVPQQVTRRQALQALLIRGVTSAMIETAINSLPISDLEKSLALIEFRESLEFEYARPLTIQMCAVMSLNQDDLFIFAATL
jgi:hypothetical protein